MASGRSKFDKWNDEFIETLAFTANVSLACKKVGVSRKVAYSWKNKDSAKGRDFRRRWDEAIETAVDVLEGEARRRALTGVREPVFYKGEEIAEVSKYSDTLLIFLLKAHRPDTYRETKRLEHTGVRGGAPITLRELNDAELLALLGEDDETTRSHEGENSG